MTKPSSQSWSRNRRREMDPVSGVWKGRKGLYNMTSLWKRQAASQALGLVVLMQEPGQAGNGRQVRQKGCQKQRPDQPKTATLGPSPRLILLYLVKSVKVI